MANDRIIVAYFDDFVDAFRTFSGDRIAAKFAVPYLVKGEACIFRPIVTAHSV